MTEATQQQQQQRQPSKDSGLFKNMLWSCLFHLSVYIEDLAN